jgi:serine/threonine protein kinase
VTPSEEQALSLVAEAFCLAQGLRFQGSSGHGAFKANYRVERADGVTLALKVYLPGSVSERTVREIEALQKISQLGHAHLPAFIMLTQFVHGNATYLISAEEFLGGGTLSARTKDGLTISRDATVLLAKQLTSAVTEFAKLGLVHRDIKPDNVMFRADRTTAVLVDFGLVRDLGKSSLTQTWLAQGPGTPFFAAPEQLNNEKHQIDWRTDQFSLGVSLAICALGTHPYQRPGDSTADVVGRVATRESPHADFLSGVERMGLVPLRRMVAPWSVRRFRTTQEMAIAWSQV